MKRYIASALLLLSLLSACSGGQASPAPSADSRSADELAQALLEAGSFSETLEALDSDVTLALYGLEEGAPLDSAAYLSTGATAEECTVLIFADQDRAAAGLSALQARVEDQLAALKNYQPQEVSKLEAALTGTKPMASGVAAYLVVAQDSQGCSSLLAQ